MTASTAIDEAGGRRSFLIAVIVTVQAAIAALLAAVVGRVVIGPSGATAVDRWLPAAPVAAVTAANPLPVTLRAIRYDGFSRVVDRIGVYLVRTDAGDAEVQALHATCTHLGCRTRYDPTTQRILCPCHGGTYDARGRVIGGPPPKPLTVLPTQIRDGRVFVRV
ncbi:MAG: ubiquinol-cytochrome c reductase iron-sulfur subunit [Vicinamibacterales bacterium]